MSKKTILHLLPSSCNYKQIYLAIQAQLQVWGLAQILLPRTSLAGQHFHSTESRKAKQ